MPPAPFPYAGCSTGQQWDGISYRVFGKELPRCAPASAW